MADLIATMQAAAGVGGDKLYVEDVFSTYLWTGTNSANTITNGIDLAGEGGMVWTKWRSITNDHMLVDTDRGALKVLKANSTSSEVTNGNNAPSSFLSDGFTYTDNGSGYPIASWTWRKAPKFFDVVTYTGNGVAGRTVAHNLGSVPGCIIVKRVNNVSNWGVYHRSLPNTDYLLLNSTAQQQTSSTFWNNTTPTETEFTVGTNQVVNASGSTYVAYLFAHDAGGFGDDGDQSIISCGSYTGNGSNSITNFVNLGWEPQWVLVKNAGISPSEPENWYLVDNMRGSTPNEGAVSAYLRPDLSSAEVSPSLYGIAVASQGFYAVGNDGKFNRSGQTYIYIAIRRGPMKTPESGTEVFSPVAYTGDGASSRSFTNPNFAPDLIWTKSRSNGTDNKFMDRLRGTGRGLNTNDTGSEGVATGYYVTEYGSLGWTLGIADASYNNSGYTYGAGAFRRAPGFFDVVAYAGDSTLGRAVNHNLGVAPELIILKNRTLAGGGAKWVVALSSTAPNEGALSNSNGFAAYGNITAFGSTTFTLLNGASEINNSSYNYIAYLFATVAGVSKVGSYTGTAADINVDCGFTTGARFVLVKRTDSAGDWYVWDSARGIVAGNDPYLLLNSAAAEVTGTDYIDPLASGFTVTSSAPAALNASGGTYIFLAIA